MEYSAFLQLDDVRGESRTAPCLGWIPLASASSPMGRASGNRDVLVVAPHGIHSGYLYKAVSDGTEFRKGEIAFVRDGSKHLAWTMEAIVISGFHLSSGMDGVPMEAITLAPREIKYSRG